MTTATARNGRKAKAKGAREAALQALRETQVETSAAPPDAPPEATAEVAPLCPHDLPDGAQEGECNLCGEHVGPSLDDTGDTLAHERGDLDNREATPEEAAAYQATDPVNDQQFSSSNPTGEIAQDDPIATLHVMVADNATDAEMVTRLVQNGTAEADAQAMISRVVYADPNASQVAAAIEADATPPASTAEWTDDELREYLTLGFNEAGGRLTDDAPFLVDGTAAVGVERMQTVLASIASHNSVRGRWTLAGTPPEEAELGTYMRAVDGIDHKATAVNGRYHSTACGLLLGPQKKQPAFKAVCDKCYPGQATTQPAASTPPPPAAATAPAAGRKGKKADAEPKAPPAPKAAPAARTTAPKANGDVVGDYKTVPVEGGFAIVGLTGEDAGKQRLEIFPALEDAQWYAGRRTRLAKITGDLYQPKVGNTVGDFKIERDATAKTVWLTLDGKKISPVFHDPVNGDVDAMRYGERLSRPNRRASL